MQQHLEKFNTKNILAKIETFLFDKDKIKYLVEIKTEYIQLSLDDKLTLGDGLLNNGFEYWCIAEINKIKEIGEINKFNFLSPTSLESTTPNPNLKTQTANYLLLNELGIINFLKDRYKDQISNDTDLAKILCQIMRYENENEINSMRSLIKNHRKSLIKNHTDNSPKVETDKAMNEVKQIMTYHKLI